jgi:ribose transport system substrate-binding protein
MTMEMLEANPNIKVVYATNERSTLGVCEAVKDLGKAGEVKVIGFNSNNTELEYLKSGTLTGLVIQNPYNMGYLGVYYAGILISGKTAPHNVDTGATFINMENFNNDEIQLLLDPAGFIEKNKK